MTLTEEQKERMRKNRERALEIQKRRREELELANKTNNDNGGNNNNNNNDDENKREGEDKDRVEPAEKRAKLNESGIKADKIGQEEEEYDDDLEAFEEGASDLVTKKEAKKMYCLPEGTLEVCAVVEKDNPHHKGWSKMKLYNRSEVRRRARKRFGGKEGLIAERRKREEERFRNDIEKTKDIFKKK